MAGANIQANVQIANVIVSSTPNNVIITEGNTSIANLVTTTTTVNVSQQAYTVNVAALATVANSAIRKAISVANVSGYGNISFDNTISSNGVIQYRGITDPEIRKTISHQNISGFGNVDYANANGVISFTGVSEAEIAEVITQNPANVRTAISATNTGGYGTLNYSNITGVMSYTGVSAQEIRAEISVNDTGGDGNLTYNATSGVITYTGPNQTEANARIAAAPLQVRAHLSADSNITYDANTGVIGQALYTQDVTEGDLLYLNGAGTTDDLAEGNANLWYTDARVENYLSDPNTVGRGKTNRYYLDTLSVSGATYIQEAIQTIGAIDSRGAPAFKVSPWTNPADATPWQALQYNAVANTNLRAYIGYVETDANSNPFEKWVFSHSGNLSNYYILPETTTDLTEGANLYYTTDRANSAIVTYFGDAANGPFTINGNLEVNGNIDYVNVEDLLVNDQSITLNYGNATARDAFIYVDRSGSALNNAHLKWNETTDLWEIYDGSNTFPIPRSTTDLAEGTNLYLDVTNLQTVTPTANLKVKQFHETVQNAGNVSGAVSFNLANGTIIESTVVGNVDSISFTGLTAGSRASIIMEQDATGNHIVLAPNVPIPTGGTVTTDGTYVYHTFTGDGEFRTYSDIDYTYLVVGGGGGGGSDSVISFRGGGGGGAGGYVTGNSTLNSSSISVTVGAGGAVDGNGANSSLGNIVAIGGGAGGQRSGAGDPGSNGGSGGGGGSGSSIPTAQPGGTGSQGNNGGSSITETSGGAPISYAGGGGGGASQAGDNASIRTGGDGGNGSVWINGVTYAGGGGGYSYGSLVPTPIVTVGGTGGTGGGGYGGNYNTPGEPGTDGLGGGGGGNQVGGSGTVVIAYLLSEISPATHTADGNWINWHFEDGDAQLTPDPASKTLVEVMYDGAEYYSTFKQFEANTIGDIQAVVAGSGLTGGGTSGTVTLDVGAGTGITVNADDIEVDMSAFTTTDLAEGANLYYTEARVNAAIDARVVSTTANVDSVNGQTGVVTLDTGDIAENGNLYFTDARANSAIDARVTKTFVDGLGVDYTSLSNLPTIPTHTSNLVNDSGFITSATANVISVNGQTGVVSLDTDDITEGATNKYYSTTLANADIDARVTKAFVDALGVDASTLDGNVASYYLDYNNFVNTPAPYGDANVDAHLNTATASTNEVLSWDGADYAWVPQGGAGGYGNADVQNFLENGYSTANIDANDIVAVTFTGDGSDLTSVRAETIEVTIKNADTVQIDKGMPVHAIGTAVGGEIEVVLADAGNASLMPAHFIANETLASTGDSGRGILSGRIFNVDTSSFTVGDTIFVGVGGGYANVAPSGEANLIQNLGVVTDVAVLGSGEVYGAGRAAATPNLDTGAVFAGSSANKAVAVDTTTNFAVSDTTFDLSNNLTNINSITSEPSADITLNSENKLVITQQVNGSTVFAGNVESSGYAIQPGSNEVWAPWRYANPISYSAGELKLWVANCDVTAGSNVVTVNSIVDIDDPNATPTTANINVYQVVSDSSGIFGTQNYVTSVDAANNTFTINIAANKTASGVTTGIQPGGVDPNTGLVLVINSNAQGNITSIVPRPIVYGYPRTGPSATDFNWAFGTASDYTFGDFTPYMMAKTEFEAPDTSFTSPRGIVVGPDGDMSESGYDDITQAFGQNIFWSGRPLEDSYANGLVPQTQLLIRSYMDNNVQTFNPGGTGPRLVLQSNYANVDASYNLTYARQNQELGRILFTSTNARMPKVDNTSPPAFISAYAANDYDAANSRTPIAFGGNRDRAGNADVYMGAVSDALTGFGNPDIYLAYQQGRLTLASGNNQAMRFAPAETIDGSILHTAYSGGERLWAELNYVDTGNAYGSKFTVTNGGAVSPQVGDMQIGIVRVDNDGSVTNKDYTFNLQEQSDDLLFTVDGNSIVTYHSNADVTFHGNVASVNGVTTDNINASFYSGVVLGSNNIWIGSGSSVPTETAFDTALSTNITQTNVKLQQFAETVVALGSVSGDQSSVINAANGSIYSMTLTGGVTINSIANATAGTSMTLILTQDGTGNHTLTSSMKFAGGTKTLSTGPGDIDIISVFYDGSNYYASLTTDYQ